MIYIYTHIEIHKVLEKCQDFYNSIDIFWCFQMRHA